MQTQIDDPLILVVANSDAAAEQLKELLEFMDALPVESSTVDNWRSRVGKRRLSAVFLGQDLSRVENERLVRELGKFDPDVSIVLIEDQQHAA